MERDVFALRDHGRKLAECALSLGADTQPEMAPKEEAQRQFEWSPKGLGIYVANNAQEQQVWLQRLSDWSGGGCGNVPEPHGNDECQKYIAADSR